MTSGYIRYRSKYKHQLAEGYKTTIRIKPSHDMRTEFINLDTQGNMTIKKGYAWHGVATSIV